MNKKLLPLVALAAATWVFVSCEEQNLYEEEKQPEVSKNVTDLVIPEDFDWHMITDARCEISATKASSVSIFLDEKGSEDQLLATLTTVAGQTISIPLNLAAHVREIYIAYETVGGRQEMQAVAVDEKGLASFVLPEETAEARSVWTTRSARASSSDAVWIPSAGTWGTILFEDMFPLLGDYDFNDYVLKYQLSAQDLSWDGGICKTSSILVGIRVAAIGGNLPYTPSLRLLGLANENVEGMDIYKMSSTAYDESNAIRWDNEGEPDMPVILDFRKVVDAIERPAGSSYFNTEKDYASKNEDNYQAVIYLRTPVEVAELYADKLDYYLRKTDGTEIHLQGFQPVSYDYSFTDGVDPKTYYRSDKGFVWGLNVPGDVPHVVEQVSFLSAYKDFEKWVVSGGQEGSDWYQGAYDSDFLLR